MSDEALFGPVEYGNGCRWNPLTSADDPPEVKAIHALLDVAVALRGAVPNLNLGMFDEFFWAGEGELALEELEHFVKNNPDQSSALAETLLRRVRPIWNSVKARRNKTQPDTEEEKTS